MLDFLFGLPKDLAGNIGIVDFADGLSEMTHLAGVPHIIDGEGTATLFIDRVFRQDGLPVRIATDRDPRFTGKFWKSICRVLGTRLDMSSADHPHRGPVVKLNVSIASLKTLSALCVVGHRSAEAQCSLSSSLR